MTICEQCDGIDMNTIGKLCRDCKAANEFEPPETELCKICKEPSGYEFYCSEACFKKACTCTDCASNDVCAYAFDDYNTNGDCLAEK